MLRRGSRCAVSCRAAWAWGRLWLVSAATSVMAAAQPPLQVCALAAPHGLAATQPAVLCLPAHAPLQVCSLAATQGLAATQPAVMWLPALAPLQVCAMAATSGLAATQPAVLALPAHAPLALALEATKGMAAAMGSPMLGVGFWPALRRSGSTSTRWRTIVPSIKAGIVLLRPSGSGDCLSRGLDGPGCPLRPRGCAGWQPPSRRQPLCRSPCSASGH